MGLMTGYADGSVPQTALQYVFTLALMNLGLFAFAYTVGVLSVMGESGGLHSQAKPAAGGRLAAGRPQPRPAHRAPSGAPRSRGGQRVRLSGQLAAALPAAA